MQREDDEAWKAIVENYGDRAELDDAEPVLEDDVADGSDAAPARTPEEVRPPRETFVVRPPEPVVEPALDDDEDRFVPPTPPPLPRTTTDLLIAWIGLFGSPAVLLVCLIVGIDIPELLAYLLVAGFIGGFLYLVFKMPREPRDPDDDGAVL